MKYIKGIAYGLCVIIVILIFTNPTLSNFKEFIPSHSKTPFEEEKLIVSKESNYLIFSVYKYRIVRVQERGYENNEEVIESGTFTGFMKNFYKK